MDKTRFKLITPETSAKIIETRKPEGLFYLNENGVWVGIDNSTGGAIVESFHKKRNCLHWLNGDFEVFDLYERALRSDF